MRGMTKRVRTLTPLWMVQRPPPSTVDAKNEYLAWTMGGDLRRTQSPGSIWARSPFPPSEKEDVPPEPGSDEWIDRRLQELETLGCSSPSKRGYCDHSTFRLQEQQDFLFPVFCIYLCCKDSNGGAPGRSCCQSGACILGSGHRS